MKGVVLKSTGSWYLVQIEGMEEPMECRIKGKFRLNDLDITNPVAVGDIVTVLAEEGQPGKGVITDIQERHNYLIRQSPRQKHQRHIIAANIDQALLLATFSQPRTSLGFIDRFLVAAEVYQIPVIILFNKSDIYTEEDTQAYKAAKALYADLGYPCLRASALTGYHIDKVKQLLASKTTVVSGHSGVGKSALLNNLQPDLGLRTQNISAYSEKGMHTTTFAEMFQIQGNTYIIDTPGIKEFGLVHIEPPELSHYFREMKPLLEQCRFNNCLHRNEIDCAVKKAFVKGTIADSRYMNYLNMLESIEEINYWERK